MQEETEVSGPIQCPAVKNTDVLFLVFGTVVVQWEWVWVSKCPVNKMNCTWLTYNLNHPHENRLFLLSCPNSLVWVHKILQLQQFSKSWANTLFITVNTTPSSSMYLQMCVGHVTRAAAFFSKVKADFVVDNLNTTSYSTWSDNVFKTLVDISTYLIGTINIKSSNLKQQN